MANQHDFSPYWKESSHPSWDEFVEMEYPASTPVVEPKAAYDKQVGGDHYKQFRIQPAHYCYVNKLNNLESEVISYVSRARFKWADNKDKQIEDYKKAIHTIELLMEELNGHQ